MVHALCRPNRILLTKRKFTFHHFKGGGGGERERGDGRKIKDLFLLFLRSFLTPLFSDVDPLFISM